MSMELKHELVKQLNKWSETATYMVRIEPPYLIGVSRLGKDDGDLYVDGAAHRLVCLVSIRCDEFHSVDIRDAMAAIAHYMRSA